MTELPPSWHALLGPLLQSDAYTFIQQQLLAEPGLVYPPASLRWNAFAHCAPHDVKVVILGQDPYHGPGQAMGLSFSVPAGVRVPPSLRNIYKEIEKSCNVHCHATGDLTRWARQGVLLLNALLSVRAGAPASHRHLGWESITDSILQQISAQCDDVVFLLWGAFARKKAQHIDATKHLVLTAPHPSPLSAYRGFFGCQHFVRANEYLAKKGRTPIDWR